VIGLEQPVRVQQLHRDPAAAVSRRYRQAPGAFQNARRADDEWEAPMEVQILDPGLHHRSRWEACPQAFEHLWMDVDADEIDARRRKGYGQASGAHAQVENRSSSLPAPPEPRLQINRIRNGGIQLGEAGVWILRIIPNHAAHVRTIRG